MREDPFARKSVLLPTLPYFFGAGNATYFEAFSLTIYFYRRPNKKLQQEILKLLPKQLKASISDFQGNFLHIYTKYGQDKMQSLYKDNFSTINMQIEEAIIKIHKIAPISFVYRPEDTKAEGTEFSQWHYDSDPSITLDVVPLTLNDLPVDETIALRECLKEIIALYGLEDEYRGYFREKCWKPKKKPINNEVLLRELQECCKLNANNIGTELYKIYKDKVYQEDTFYVLFNANKSKVYREQFLDAKYISEILSYAKKIDDAMTMEFLTDYGFN